MTKITTSLKARLFVMILWPLVLISTLLGFWRYFDLLETTKELYDRSLLLTALSVSRDVTSTEGDIISPATQELIDQAAGGEVFYHLMGPDGIYLTGYAYPPAPPTTPIKNKYKPFYFQGEYRGEAVRVMRISERTEIRNFSGDTTVTVWQRMQDRENFAQQMALQIAGLLILLLSILAGVVWFAVKRGLLPLLDLQNAIGSRSPNDLSIIRRSVPLEVSGIVQTLNLLFKQVEHSITLQQEFISNAAHQLRNPANALYSMASSLRDAKTEDDRKQRLNELITAARLSARLSDQLLSLDRLYASEALEMHDIPDLHSLVEEVCLESAPPLLGRGIDFSFEPCKHLLSVSGHHIFLSEAVRNLIDNAEKHGGQNLTEIRVLTNIEDTYAAITITDNGRGLSPEDEEKAFSRFGQIDPSSGSGLGLSIASSIAEKHAGRLRIDPVETGASLTLLIPLLEKVPTAHATPAAAYR